MAHDAPPPERVPLDPHTFGEEQQCFGCGPHNHHGMQLRFFREGDEVVTTFEAREGWEGAPGIVHGGLQATLADEIGAWTLIGLKGRFGFTSSLQLRYLQTMKEVAGDKTNTIIFPLPLDLIEPLMEAGKALKKDS